MLFCQKRQSLYLPSTKEKKTKMSEKERSLQLWWVALIPTIGKKYGILFFTYSFLCDQCPLIKMYLCYWLWQVKWRDAVTCSTTVYDTTPCSSSLYYSKVPKKMWILKNQKLRCDAVAAIAENLHTINTDENFWSLWYLYFNWVGSSLYSNSARATNTHC
jgi:hypothetical protein